ncbi:hypothetical protein J6590_070813 [Homalodisca vitripennis]|nr:hypothetical protein J6590_070813 [Homalodisca vitripennis]
MHAANLRWERFKQTCRNRSVVGAGRETTFCYHSELRSERAGVKTEDVLHGFTHAQYDRNRIVHNTVASPVEHGRRGCPGAETFW